ncbi:MAG: hypothetical protein ABSG16_23460 [Candidatus Acidiferrum sp.]
MPVTARQVLLMACFFLLGVCVGRIAIPTTSSFGNIPVNVDFCFLEHNPALFKSTPFITSANITNIQPHGYVLTSPSCPDVASGFAEQHDDGDLYMKLQRKFDDDPQTPIPVSFEGSIYWPSATVVWWRMVKWELHLRGNEFPDGWVTINNYKFVGPQT